MNDSSNFRIRLKDVAAAAGVSHTTVSMALRNHPSIPPATRERISKIARDMGYYPDPEIAKLMERIRGKRVQKLGNTIAYITAFVHRDEWMNIYTMRKYFEYAQQRAQESGFKLEQFWLREPGISARRLSEVIRNRGIENVIIAPLPGPVWDQQTLFDGFRWSYFSAVALGYSFQATPICRACFHHFDAMTMLMRKLLAMGYQNPGLSMSLSMDDRTHHFYRSAYLSEQSLAPLRRQIPVDITSDGDRTSFKHWYKTHLPDIVLAFSADVHRWMLDLGLKIPSDIGFALLDRPADAAGFCGVDQQPYRIASAAVDLLLSLHRVGDRGVPSSPRVVMTEGSFIRGQTVRSTKALKNC